MKVFVFEYMIKERYPGGDDYFETMVIHAETQERAEKLRDDTLAPLKTDHMEMTVHDGEYVERFWE